MAFYPKPNELVLFGVFARCRVADFTEVADVCTDGCEETLGHSLRTS